MWPTVATTLSIALPPSISLSSAYMIFSKQESHKIF